MLFAGRVGPAAPDPTDAAGLVRLLTGAALAILLCAGAAQAASSAWRLHVRRPLVQWVVTVAVATDLAWALGAPRLSFAVLIGLAVAACDPLRSLHGRDGPFGASVTVEATLTLILGLVCLELLAGSPGGSAALLAAGTAGLVGLLAGAATGWAVGRITRYVKMGAGAEVDWLLAGLGLAAYGAASRLGGYGLLATAVAGLVWARVNQDTRRGAVRPMGWLAGAVGLATLGAVTAGISVDFVQGSVLLVAVVLLLRPLTIRIVWPSRLPLSHGGTLAVLATGPGVASLYLIALAPPELASVLVWAAVCLTAGIALRALTFPRAVLA